MLVVKPCRLLVKNEDFSLLLALILDIGNKLNAGTQRGDAKGFRLTSLLRLQDIRASSLNPQAKAQPQASSTGPSLLQYIVDCALAT